MIVGKFRHFFLLQFKTLLGIDRFMEILYELYVKFVFDYLLHFSDLDVYKLMLQF